MKAPAMKTTLALLLLCTLACLAGCGMRTSPSSRFYMPVALAAPAAQPQAQAKPGALRVGLGPLRLAEYLDRPQIVTRGAGVEVRMAEFDRWAEPLEDSVTRVVAQNVSALLGSHSVEVFPWSSGSDPACQVRGEILRLDGDLGRDAVLDAWFSVSDASGRKGDSHKVSYREPAGSSYADLVLAESRLLERLSRDIAAALKEQLPR